LVLLPILGASTVARAAGQATTEEWVEILAKSEDASERARAARELASGARAAKRALLRALTDEDERVREAARAALAEYGVEASASTITPAERRGAAYVWTENVSLALSEKGKQFCQTALTTDVQGRVWLSYLDCDYRQIHDGRWIAWPRRVMLLCSSDGGRTFSQPEPLAQSGGDEALAADQSGNLFASWVQYTEKGSELRHWVVVQRIDKNGLQSHLRAPLPLDEEMRQLQADIHVDAEGGVHVVWMDDRDGNGAVYHTVSTDGGETFSEVSRVSDTRFPFPALAPPPPPATQDGSWIGNYLSITGVGDEVIVAWSDQRAGLARSSVYAAVGAKD